MRWPCGHASLCGVKSSTLRELRADARSNRDRLLLAARDAFVDLGPDAPLDEVARRAGVGIATLYRRFPDPAALMQAVALDILTRIADPTPNPTSAANTLQGS